MIKDFPSGGDEIAEQLSQNYYTAYEEIRTLGLSVSPSEKFAKPLLSWSTKPVTTDDGSSQVKLTLTHEETNRDHGDHAPDGERLFSEFKKKQLMQLSAATLVIRGRVALERIVKS